MSKMCPIEQRRRRTRRIATAGRINGPKVLSRRSGGGCRLRRLPRRKHIGSEKFCSCNLCLLFCNETTADLASDISARNALARVTAKHA